MQGKVFRDIVNKVKKELLKALFFNILSALNKTENYTHWFVGVVLFSCFLSEIKNPAKKPICLCPFATLEEVSFRLDDVVETMTLTFLGSIHTPFNCFCAVS